MSQSRNANPQIKWHGKTVYVALPMEGDKLIEAKWSPKLTYIIRVKEAGADDWSFGVETPLSGCTFVDLKPDTEYEVQVRAKGAAGEGEPTVVRLRTNPAGDSGNVIPFPSRPRQ